MIHNEPHPLAGKAIAMKMNINTNPPVRKGDMFIVEDWWDRLTGKSWMDTVGNITVMTYSIRSGFKGLPYDNEVVYGKVNGASHLVHISELSNFGD